MALLLSERGVAQVTQAHVGAAAGMKPSGPIVVAVTDSEVRLLSSAQRVRVFLRQCLLSACT